MPGLLPGVLRSARVVAAGTMIRSLGGAPLVAGTQPGSRRFLQMMAVGAKADPAISRLLHDIFAATPAAGRGAWARALVDELGPRVYIDLSGLTVPALVVGIWSDILYPSYQQRQIRDLLVSSSSAVQVCGRR